MESTAIQYYCFDCDTVSENDKCPVCGGVAKEGDNLAQFTLQDRRQHVIEKINAPLLMTLIELANRLKIEPTKQNTFNPMALALMDVWDKFFETEHPGREPLFRAMKKESVARIERDPYYRDAMSLFLELFVEAILEGKVPPRPFHNYPTWGVEPQVKGIGYEFIKDRYYHAEKYREQE